MYNVHMKNAKLNVTNARFSAWLLGCAAAVAVHICASHILRLSLEERYNRQRYESDRCTRAPNERRFRSGRGTPVWKMTDYKQLFPMRASIIVTDGMAGPFNNFVVSLSHPPH